MAKYLLSNLQKLNVEQLHVRNQLQFNEDNYQIHHTLDPDNGKYEVKNNVNGKVILSVNHDGTLNSSILKNYQDDKSASLQTQINAHTSTLASHTTSINSHGTRLSSLESATLPYTSSSGTTTNNTVYTIATIPINSNVSGSVYGYLTSKSFNCEFNVFLTNSGSLNINSYNMEYNYAGSSEEISFDVSGSNLLIKLKNANSVCNYLLSYSSTLLNL